MSNIFNIMYRFLYYKPYLRKNNFI